MADLAKIQTFCDAVAAQFRPHKVGDSFLGEIVEKGRVMYEAHNA